MRGIFHWIMKIKRVIGRRNQSLMALIFCLFLSLSYKHSLMIFCFHIFFSVFINILITPLFSEVPMKQKHIYRLTFFLCHGFCSWQSCRKDLFSFYFRPTIRSEFCRKQPDLFCLYDIPKMKTGGSVFRKKANGPQEMLLWKN